MDIFLQMKHAHIAQNSLFRSDGMRKYCSILVVTCITIPSKTSNPFKLVMKNESSSIITVVHCLAEPTLTN